MAKQQSKDLVTKEMTDLMVQQAGSGMEGVQTEDLAIPFISILQSNSPQCKKSNTDYIEGAEEGMIFNSVTGEMFRSEEGILVLPCGFTRHYIEWKPRNEGGGFIAQHPRDTDLVSKCTFDENGRMVTPSGTHLVDTANHFVLLLTKNINDELETQKAVIAMASSNLTTSRKWNSLMTSKKIKHGDNMITPPSYAFSYKLTGQPASNDKGDWIKWKVEEGEQVTDMALFKEGMAFALAVKQGDVKVSTPVTGDPEQDGVSESHI